MSFKKDYLKVFDKREGYDAYQNVFDDSTLRTIFKLESQGYIDKMLSPVKLGKEANIFSAKRGESLAILKIYRKSAHFKKMYEYMAPDHRFSGLKRNSSIIYLWAKKEFRNLLKAKSAGVSVPMPYAVQQNVLVMEFIGKNSAAKQLNAQSPEDPQAFYETLINNIRKLYHDAKLIHGDLSEFNILNDDERPVIIDLSHAVDLRYPNVYMLLERDIRIICNYFNKQGLTLDYKEEIKKCISRN